MDTSDVMLPLIQNEEVNEYCYDAHDEMEDVSSGYESSDSAENQTIPTFNNDKSSAETRKCRLNQDGSFKFKNTRMLCEDLKLILEMPEMCDVTFLVGPDEVPIHGVRAILGTRSRVFYQLILQHIHTQSKMSTNKKIQRQSHRLYIPVKKYDTQVFRMLIQYVHCGVVTITPGNVIGLLCGAKQFLLDELEDACWQFIRRYLISGCLEKLLKSARRYKHFRVTDAILNEIYVALDRRLIEKTLESTV